MKPLNCYPKAMERRPPPGGALAADAVSAFLAGAAMFDCTRFPCTARISERQCLINQERAASSGYPAFCLECPAGEEIKARHPEGSGQAVKYYCIDGTVNRPAELKAAREAKGRETGDGVPTSPEKPVRDLAQPAPPEPEKVAVMMDPGPTLPEKVEQLIEASAPLPKVPLTPEDELRLEVKKVLAQVADGAIGAQKAAKAAPLPPAANYSKNSNSSEPPTAPALCVTCGQQPPYGQADQCFKCLVRRTATKARREADYQLRWLQRRKRANEVEKISPEPGGVEQPLQIPPNPPLLKGGKKRRRPAWWFDATPAVQASWLRENG